MSMFWKWLRNNWPTASAYRDVSTEFSDDFVSQPLFAALREFAETPAAPTPIPVLLLEEFNASQKRAIRRKKLRAGSGALFGVAILIPSLAYAGVLPTPVSRMVQRVFNVVSLPIHIPSVSLPSEGPSPTAPNSVGLIPGSTTPAPVETPEEGSILLPGLTIGPTPTDEGRVEPSQSPSSEPSQSPSSEPDSILPIPGETGQDRGGTGVLGTSGGEITGQLGVSTETPEVPEPVSPASPSPSESDPSAGD